jgi:transposase InsO family protein
MAVLRRPVEPKQYTSIAFGLRCREAGVRPSMGSVGDAYDNALCESFFATLECELLDRRRFQSHAEARMAVFEYLEGWYNPDRRHSALAYQSPSQLREEPGAPELNAQAINCPPNRANSSGALECGGSPFLFQLC